MSCRGMCAGNAVFYHTKVVSESKIVREMPCFTIETAMRLCEGRMCKTAGADMFAYRRLWSDIVGSVLHWEVQAQVVKRIGMVGLQVVQGSGWRRCVIGESHGRCPW